MGGFVEIVDMLIAAGARLDAEDRNDNTALIWAVDRGHAEVARRLLAAGADPNLQNRQGLTALMVAAQRGYLGIARQLVRAEAALDMRDRSEERRVGKECVRPCRYRWAPAQ